jgi:hypothetical protein
MRMDPQATNPELYICDVWKLADYVLLSIENRIFSGLRLLI